MFDSDRASYAWMSERMAERLGEDTAFDAPVWCWHSCHDGFDGDTQRGAAPTDETARDLFGVFLERDRLEIDRLELEVPDELVLLSSYKIWNDFYMDGEEVPDGGWARMFEEPLLDHHFDDIQAVIPWIEPEWVNSIDELVLRGDMPSPGTLRHRMWWSSRQFRWWISSKLRN